MRLFDSYRRRPEPKPEPAAREIVGTDICVIGAGPGGLAVAASVAAFGVGTVLVEKGRLGGLDHGGVASKALIAAARQAHAIGRAAEFGIKVSDRDVDFKAVMRQVRTIVAATAPNRSVERLGAMGVRVIKAQARFKDKRTLIAGEFEIRARRFVVAAGSSSVIPPIPGLEAVGYLTEATIFDLIRRPSHLIVIGGGPAGLELAQAFRRLGSRVTVVEEAAALGGADPEIAAIVLRSLRAEGVAIHEWTKVVGVEQRGKTGLKLLLETPGGAAAIDGSHLLIATDRTANVDGLDLDKAGVDLDGDGIDVSAMLRTTNRRIYAIGDVAGPFRFTHIADYHASRVVRALLFRLPAKADRRPIPWAVFTDPELAHVGLDEAEARRKHKSVRILRWPYAENDRARVERKTAGHIKLVVRKGKLLGVTIVGEKASEMIGVWTLALANGLGLRDVAGLVAPYPTMSEIGKRAAMAYFAPATRSRLPRVALWWLRLFR